LTFHFGPLIGYENFSRELWLSLQPRVLGYRGTRNLAREDIQSARPPRQFAFAMDIADWMVGLRAAISPPAVSGTPQDEAAALKPNQE
jgi:hypothetical protein